MRSTLPAFAGIALAAAGCGDLATQPADAPEAAGGAAATYTVVPLPRPDAPAGFSPGRALAVNRSGTAVGWIRGPANEIRAAAWTDGERVDLPGLVEGAVSQARDINGAGDIAGSSENADGQMRAVLWQNGFPRSLGTLGGTFSIAHGINDRGEVVGMSETGTGLLHAFVWTGGQMRDLGRLPGTETSVAVAINGRGEIVGHSIGGVVLQRATLWRDGEIVDLGTLGNESGASDINAKGLIVGGSFPFDQTEARAVIWEREEIRDLGSLDDSFSSANGINDRGQVVGATRAPDCEQCPFVWERGTMRSLEAPGGAIASASDINEAGTVVGGAGEGIGPLLWRPGPPKMLAGAARSVPAGFSLETPPPSSRPSWADAVCASSGRLGPETSALEIAAGC